ncbi:MAG: hypothetical protein K1X71_09205 [Pirellulales bacterium]|nr:hypothetical protein [Pirellulales bacterium]
MSILLQFIYRLSFGLALAMGLTSGRLVPSGYFRVHLYVLLGMNALAAIVTWQQPELGPVWLPIAISFVSYVGSALWLYEASRAGRIALLLVALLSVVAAWQEAGIGWPTDAAGLLRALDSPTSGLVLGATMAAMLLGHWYLNTPTMRLDPLKKLVGLILLAVALRVAVVGLGLTLDLTSEKSWSTDTVWFLLLRWLAGIVGTIAVAIMAGQTLKIPNTQSATGILYVGVIVTFIGELTSQLLSRQTLFPL